MCYMSMRMDQYYESFENMIQEYFDEFDGFICCCMAAGVSSDQLILTIPKLDHNFDNTVCVTTHVGFKPLGVR